MHSQSYLNKLHVCTHTQQLKIYHKPDKHPKWSYVPKILSKAFLHRITAGKALPLYAQVQTSAINYCK